MFAWLRKLSWKWKILVVFIIGFMFLMIFIMTPWGQDIMRDKVEQYYNETPEAERRDSPWADRYLALAWFRGTLLGHTKDSLDMYRKFLGIEDETTAFTTFKLKGLCSVDGKTGWGPCHPRAPEAYWNYLDTIHGSTSESDQFIGEKCYRYHVLLYQIASYCSPDHKPNPNFKKYWQKVINMAAGKPFGWPNIDKSAPLAPNVDPDR